MTTPVDLDALEALMARAARSTDALAGEFCEHGIDRNMCPMRGCGPGIEEARDELIAAAPALIAELRELRERVEKASVLLDQAASFIGRHGFCSTAGQFRLAADELRRVPLPTPPADTRTVSPVRGEGGEG